MAKKGIPRRQGKKGAKHDRKSPGHKKNRKHF